MRSLRKMISMILVFSMLFSSVVPTGLAEATPSEPAVSDSKSQEPEASGGTDSPLPESTPEPEQATTVPSVESTPESGEGSTSDVAPEETPEPTSEATLEQTPEDTPEVTVEPTPVVTPESTLEVTPDPFVAGYMEYAEGTRIYAHSSMQGKHVTLKEKAVVYAYDLAQTEDYSGVEVLYALEDSVERGYIRKEGKIYTDEEVRTYRGHAAQKGISTQYHGTEIALIPIEIEGTTILEVPADVQADEQVASSMNIDNAISLAAALAAPEIEPIGTQYINAPFKIRWRPVENAEGYSVSIVNELGEGEFSGASQIVDAEGYCYFNANSGVAKAGTWTVTISAYAAGYDTVKSTSTFEAVVAGELDSPQVEEIGTQYVRTAFRIRWQPVEHATKYAITIFKGTELPDIYTSDGWEQGNIDTDGMYYFDVTETRINEIGRYTAIVTATGEGYDPVEVRTEFEVIASTAEYQYTIADAGVTITAYLGGGGDVVIPDMIEGRPVISIGDSAFEQADSIASVVIPDTVISIGAYAFQWCSGLSTVKWPSALKKIGAYAFANTGIIDVALPDGVTSIGDRAFRMSAQLASVTLPESLNEIGTEVFQNCTNLVCATLAGVPDSGVDFDIFRNCSSLEAFDIPGGLETVSGFNGCSGLKELVIPDGALRIGGMTNCTALEKVLIPASVTVIEGSTFEGCALLTIWGYKGSAAEQYANENGIPFHALDLDTTLTPPAFTMSAAEIYFGQLVTFEVTASDVEKVQLYVDGEAQENGIVDIVDGVCSLDWLFDHTKETYEIAFSAYADNKWSALCESQTLKVIYFGKLEPIVIEPFGTVMSGTSLTVNWNAQESVDHYSVSLYTVVQMTLETADFLVDSTITEKNSWTFWIEDAGDYYVTVQAFAKPGYETCDTARADFTVIEEQLTPPVLSSIDDILLHQSVAVLWDSVDNAESYKIAVWPTLNPELKEEHTTIDTSYTMHTEAMDAQDGEYTVTVTAQATGYTDAQASGTFTVTKLGELEPPEIDVRDAWALGNTLRIEWPPVMGATSYYLCTYDPMGYMPGYFIDENSAVVIDGKITTWLDSYSRLQVGDIVTLTVDSRADGYVYGVAQKEIRIVSLFDYEIVNNAVVITGYNGSEASVTVPDTMEGLPVVAVGDGAFERNEEIVSIVLPDSVTQIGARAFKDCINLESLVGRGVIEVGDEAFSGCSKLRVLELGMLDSVGEDAFKDVDVSIITPRELENTAEPEEGRYQNNPMIGVVHYGEGVTRISDRAHKNNDNLGEIYLPSTLESIGVEAFADCNRGAMTVTLYDGVSEISDDAFANSDGIYFVIYVKNLDTVSYVEAYAKAHSIAYEKRLYAPAVPELSISSYTVSVDETVILEVSGQAAEHAVVYLNDESIADVEFTSGYASIPYTFTKTGAYRLYVISYNGNMASSRSEEKTVTVIGLSFSVDKDSVWTCENIHFDIYSSELDGIVQLFADGILFAEVALSNGIASLDEYLTKAGERQIQAKLGGVESVVRTVTVNCIDRLEKPVLEAEAIQPIAGGMTFSWNAIDHADGYVVRVIDPNGESYYSADVPVQTGETIYTYTVPADALRGAGTYAVFVMVYGYQYDQNEAEAISIAMIEGDDIAFVMDKSEVQTGEDVKFTVIAPGATTIQLLVDGKEYETISLTDGKVVFPRAFTQSGERRISFRALRDGVWSEPCDEQLLVVTSIGKLDDPIVSMKAQHVLGANVPVKWTSVANAESYRVYVRDQDNNILYTADTADVTMTIPSDVFTSTGGYGIAVMAFAVGYDQSEGGASTEIIDHLPGPAIINPAEDVAIPQQSVEVTWEPVEGAAGYVVTLARKTSRTDESGQLIYEKVWSPDTVDVGTACSYTLNNLVYGTEYRVAVGTVSADTERIGWSTRCFSVTAPLPRVIDVTFEPTTVWPNTDVTFSIVADGNTQVMDVYLTLPDGTDTRLASLPDYDQVFGEADRHYFTFVYRFAKDGDFTLHFTPVNAQGVWSDAIYKTVTVLPAGKLPDPIVNNLSVGDIIIDENYKVTWDAVTVDESMDFGGYCVLLCEWDGSTWQPVMLAPNQYYMPVGMAAEFSLPTLTAGKRYQLELYTLHGGENEPTDALNGATKIDFYYRTVPAFSVTDIETTEILGSPITVKWDAPIWPKNPTLKPTRYVIWWYGSGLPYNEALGTNAKAFEVDGNATSFTLDGGYTAVGGTYTVNVYAVLAMSAGEEASTMALGPDSAAIQPPSITIDYPNAENNSYLYTDYIDVRGKVAGGIKYVLARLVTNSTPVELIDGAGNTVLYHIVPVENNGYYVRLSPKENMMPSEGDYTNYAVEVFGYIKAESIHTEGGISGYDAMNFCMLNIDDDEIIRFYRDGSNVHYAFVDTRIRMRANTNGAVTRIRFTKDNENLNTDTEREEIGSAQYRFDSDYFTLRTEGKHILRAYTQTGKASYAYDIYGVLHESEHIMYYNDTTKAFILRGRPLKSEAALANFSSPCEVTVIGKCDSWYLVRVNGKEGFVQSEVLSDTLIVDESAYGWHFEIVGNGTAIRVYNDQMHSDFGRFKLIMAEGCPTYNPLTIKAFDKETELIPFGVTTQMYDRVFRFSDLHMEQGKTYHFAVLYEDMSLSVISGFVLTYTYQPEGKIISPIENEAIDIWTSGNLTVTWGRYPNASSYLVQVIAHPLEPTQNEIMIYESTVVDNQQTELSVEISAELFKREYGEDAILTTIPITVRVTANDQR